MAKELGRIEWENDRYLAIELLGQDEADPPQDTIRLTGGQAALDLTPGEFCELGMMYVRIMSRYLAAVLAAVMDME